MTVAQIKQYVEMDSQEERIWEMNEKHKEREAGEEMKRRMKEIERERKEREKMGLPSFGGGRGGGSMSSMGSSGSFEGSPSRSSAPAAPYVVGHSANLILHSSPWLHLS